MLAILIRRSLCAVITSLIVLSVLPAAVVGEPSKCETCRQISKHFKEGLDKTAKSNFGGGNTNWEEKKLGSFANSETRFLEVLEQVGHDGTKECHHMVEEQEELLEQWFFLHYARGIDLDLEIFLCIDKLKVCCPEGTFGTSCTECPGGKDRPCSGNGQCKGSGTREGDGVCSCNGGYKGTLCTDCAEGFYEETRNDTHVICLACDRACNSSCSGAGRTNCDGCHNGWTQDDTEGCVDVDECESNPCKDEDYCSNNDGSYVCLRCDVACIGCTGAGPENCKACSAKHFSEDGVCKKCHASCASSCSDVTPTSCDSCSTNGWQLGDDSRTCQDVNECAEGLRMCDQQSYCVNTEGSSYCSPCHGACDGCTGPTTTDCTACRSGYVLSAESGDCIDVDECSVAAPCMAPGEKCINTVGSFRCECAAGFQRRAGKCEPKKKSAGKKKEKAKDSSKTPSSPAAPRPDFDSSPLTKDLGEPLEGQPLDEVVVMEGSLEVPPSLVEDRQGQVLKDSEGGSDGSASSSSQQQQRRDDL